MSNILKTNRAYGFLTFFNFCKINLCETLYDYGTF